MQKLYDISSLKSLPFICNLSLERLFIEILFKKKLEGEVVPKNILQNYLYLLAKIAPIKPTLKSDISNLEMKF